MNSMRPEQMEMPFRTLEARRKFTLGLPRVTSSLCPVTVLTPEGVSMLASQGIHVLFEENFGKSIHYSDDRYSRSGAQLVSRAEAFNADVVIYPAALTAVEARMLRPNALVLTLSSNRPMRQPTVVVLLERRITVLALDRVMDHRRLFPIADILGEMSGRAAVTAAASFLASPDLGKGLLPGGVAGVNPCEFVILGTGMSALAAARSAIGLGAMVRMFDSDPYCLRTAIAELGPAVIGSALHPTVLGHALSAADVVIATKLRRGFAIDDSVLDNMKKGVVIFDLDDRNGISGTFPTMRCINVADAIRQGVAPGADICLVNPAGTVQRTAAMAMTNDIIPIMERLFGTGRGLHNILKTDAGMRSAATVFAGRVVSRELAEQTGMKSVDINLLLTFS